ncbi:MAG: class I SAM-dependent methyltransferase [Chloroflexi bacterium]|nr:class I SAM-dependent methyltransferase [Chloroflexota bacterium]
MTAFDPIARYYDLDTSPMRDDLPFYENFARHAGQPILELGVGTGRVALHLARAGFAVTGLDSSPAMLTIARARAAGVPARRLALHEVDMREFDLEQQFEMALFALNTFAHLTTREDQIRALNSTWKHLNDGGLLLLDLNNVLGGRYLEQDRELVLDWVRADPDTGHTVMKLVSGYVDAVQQVQHLTFVYDETDAQGLTRRTALVFDLRYAYLPEMELLLERCGFSLEGIYGSYDLEPYTAESDRLILVARRWV